MPYRKGHLRAILLLMTLKKCKTTKKKTYLSLYKCVSVLEFYFINLNVSNKLKKAI